MIMGADLFYYVHACVIVLYTVYIGDDSGAKRIVGNFTSAGVEYTSVEWALFSTGMKYNFYR